MTKKKREAKSLPYRDPTLAVETRVRDLVERMTLSEKVRQMGMVAIADLLVHGKVSGAALKDCVGPAGVGALSDPRVDPVPCANAVNRDQKYLVEHTRLGIPGLVHGETLHGYMSPDATVFPQAIGLGSTGSSCDRTCHVRLNVVLKVRSGNWFRSMTGRLCAFFVDDHP